MYICPRVQLTSQPPPEILGLQHLLRQHRRQQRQGCQELHCRCGRQTNRGLEPKETEAAHRASTDLYWATRLPLEAAKN